MLKDSNRGGAMCMAVESIGVGLGAWLLKGVVRYIATENIGGMVRCMATESGGEGHG